MSEGALFVIFIGVLEVFFLGVWVGICVAELNSDAPRQLLTPTEQTLKSTGTAKERK